MGGTPKYLTNAEIIAKLDGTVPLQAAHIQAMRDLQENGCRYTGQDWDVRGAALSAVGKSEFGPWAAKWVGIMHSKYLEEEKHSAHARECEAAAMAVLNERKRA